MEKTHQQVEIFKDVAEASEKDLISKRRKSHKKIGDIQQVRDFIKKRELLETAEKEEKRKKVLRELLEKEKNPNWENLKEELK